MSVPFNLISWFNVTQIKIQASCFLDIYTLIWGGKRPRIANETMNKTKEEELMLHNFKTFHKATVIKIVWNVWKNRIEMKQNRKPDSAIPPLGLYPKNPETPAQKNLCTPMFTKAQFTIAKWWKQPKCPSVNEWNKKLWYIYTMEYYTADRKKELLPFVTAWLELESIMLSKISQAVKEKYHMISSISRT